MEDRCHSPEEEVKISSSSLRKRLLGTLLREPKVGILCALYLTMLVVPISGSVTQQHEVFDELKNSDNCICVSNMAIVTHIICINMVSKCSFIYTFKNTCMEWRLNKKNCD